jgi:hypothetical protein
METTPADFKNHIDNLRKTWGATFVPRPRFKEFSAGVYSPGHMANCDSKGIGPEGAFMLGKTKCYPIDSAIDWLKKQATCVKPKRVPKSAD